SPFDRPKPQERQEMLAATARRHGRAVLYVNQVGGNDSLIFDGRSMGLSATGEVTFRAAAFREVLTQVTFSSGALRGDLAAEASSWEEDVTEALCLGLSDYLRKCNFNKVVVGLSGGIDSALTAALACRALGAGRVLGVAMPSRYSSQGSVDDALDLARRLGIRCDVVPIEPIFSAFLGALEKPFAGLAEDVTEENLQARVRGTLLMAYSNKLSALLLTTGNKSEVGVGYCTLYGDMNGGLALISDLYKTEVYAVSRYLNHVAGAPIIPESTLTKAPSAELRPNQVDQDSLPPYEVLDALLRHYIDDAKSPEEIKAAGFEPAVVDRVVRLVERSEYKRRQMAPGLRVSRKAFGEGRRIPVAQRYGA
ncbi:MAG TPA: NAD+ synthase, partial [Myxococcota bacterium]|nr:NAD+ synthase [Myxococcota bacterium]